MKVGDTADKKSYRRVILIVLDACGIGGAPDAADFGDMGTNTIAHAAAANGGIRLPHLEALGLGHLTAIDGVAASAQFLGRVCALEEVSRGKDTTTGHWEIAGLKLEDGFNTFPEGFPAELIDALVQATGRGVLGNCVASGTEIIKSLGPEQEKTGNWIVYTSADSVLQIAAHEELIPLEELYAACKTVRRLCDETPAWKVGRVIARPYVGTPDGYTRTYNRHDYGVVPPEPTVLNVLTEAGIAVHGVGKISDIFCESGISTSTRTKGNADGIVKTRELIENVNNAVSGDRSLIFVNLIDFDSKFGHRRDPIGFAGALEAFDQALPSIMDVMSDSDLLMLTADHGNDPTYKGTDHTRECVPLIMWSPSWAVESSTAGESLAGQNLGVRSGFFHIAATICDAFDLPPWPRGQSLL